MFKGLKSLFVPMPPVEFIHPELGVLVSDSELWSGKMRRDGREIRFCVGGTKTAPDNGLLERLRDLLGRFADVERAALAFLRKQESDGRLGEFKFYSLDLLWEDKPDVFAMEFELAGDDDGIWRVEFEQGKPKFTGRDD